MGEVASDLLREIALLEFKGGRNFMKELIQSWKHIIFVALSLPIASFADGALRCPNGAFDAARCEIIRNDALRVGCINEQTYRELVAGNRFPACVGSTLVGDCPCGCFAGDTSIDVELSHGEKAQMLAFLLFDQWQDHSVSALEDSARLNDIRLVPRELNRATVGKERLPLVVLSLSNGRTLRLTQKHPVLKHTGQMVTAREVTRGDRVLDRRGQEVFVTRVERVREEGNVYNFETDGTTLASHVVVAEGVLVGDLAWQNALEEELGGIAIRE